MHNDFMNTLSETKAQVQVAAALQQVIYLDGLVLISAALNDAVWCRAKSIC